MKLTIKGFTDNTYTEKKTIVVDDVLELRWNSVDGFLEGSSTVDSKAKAFSFTSLQAVNWSAEQNPNL